MNIFTTALVALSAIVGHRSGLIYESQDSHISQVASFLQKEVIEVEDDLDGIFGIQYINELYNLSGSNQYLEFVLDVGYVIYDNGTANKGRVSIGNVTVQLYQ
jgi:hypothetical protein